MIDELIGGSVTTWNPKAKPKKMDLKPKYQMRFLVISNYIDPTTYTAFLSIDRIRFVYAVGMGKSVCLTSVYLNIIRDKGYHSSGDLIKGPYILHLLAVLDNYIARDTVVLEECVHTTPFRVAYETRSRGQKRDRDVLSSSEARERETYC